MNQRINELDDGIITVGYFKEEVTKMIQVASNGMWASDYPDAYEEFMKSR